MSSKSRSPKEWISWTWRADPKSPNLVSPAYRVFKLDDEDYDSTPILSKAEVESKSTTSLTEMANELSGELSVSGNYHAFSGSLKTSFKTFNLSKGSTAQSRTRIETQKKRVMLGVEQPHRKLKTGVKEFLLDPDETPEDIVRKFGEFYATEVTLGGVLNLETIVETKSEKHGREASAEVQASYKAIIASVTAGAKAGVAQESGTSGMKMSSNAKMQGGESRIWLELDMDGGNFRDVQKRWSKSVSDENLYPTNLRLVPIWKLYKKIDSGLAGEVKKFLLNKWEKGHLSLQAIDQAARRGTTGGSASATGGKIPTDVPVYLVNPSNQKCIHLHGHKNANGAPITLWSKVDQANLRWIIRKVRGEKGYYRIISQDSGKALHNHGATMNNGAPCTTWDANHPGDNLKVRFDPVPNNPGVYWIKFKQGKCVHIHGGGSGNGDKITQWDKIQQHNLYWTIQRA